MDLNLRKKGDSILKKLLGRLEIFGISDFQIVTARGNDFYGKVLPGKKIGFIIGKVRGFLKKGIKSIRMKGLGRGDSPGVSSLDFPLDNSLFIGAL